MSTNKSRVIKASLPLIVFLGLVGLLYNALNTHSRVIPSALIDKPVPQFTLPSLMTGQEITNQSLLGETYLLNVWGSWCPGCQTEHPIVEEIARQKIIPVYGFNYKDEPDDANRWLRQFGNPYKDIIADIDGRVAIDFGVYGAPETFLIDSKGIIRHKVVGILTAEIVQNELMPLIKKYNTP
jgi:cytochrome c biogenesis protein CcmG/thiol:disulfide interchange protein DsbE